MGRRAAPSGDARASYKSGQVARTQAIGAVAAAIVLLVLRQATPLAKFAELGAIVPAAIAAAHTAYGPLIVVVGFLAAGLVSFAMT
jgi:hypothetical protein